MNTKTKYLFILISTLCIICVITITLLHKDKIQLKQTQIDKDVFLSIVQLPDLSISTEASYIRHRSLSTLGDIFMDAPEHMEYFPTTFIFSSSNKRLGSD